MYIWNFNNGSKLREYAHGDEPLELCSVSHTEGQRGQGRGVRREGQGGEGEEDCGRKRGGRWRER